MSMEWLVRVFRRLRSITNGREMERDLEDELAAHIALKQAHFEEQGLSPEESSQRARLALGNPTSWKERMREQWNFGWAESLWQDVVYGARVLMRDRVFTAVALLTLAIGVGANAAIFSLLDSLLWRGLPVREPQQLVRVRVLNPPPTDRTWVNGRATTPKERSRIPFPLFERLGKHDVFDGVFGSAGEGTLVAEIGGSPYQLRMCTVTGTYFPVLGVEPAAGRLLVPADDVAGGPPAGWGVVISEAAWSRFFNRRADAIGARITLERVPFTIVGVAPRSFRGVSPGVETDVWLPLSVLNNVPEVALAIGRRSVDARNHGAFERRHYNLPSAPANGGDFARAAGRSKAARPVGRRRKIFFGHEAGRSAGGRRILAPGGGNGSGTLDADGGSGGRSVDRGNESDEPAAGAIHGAAQGDCGAGCAGSFGESYPEPVAGGEHNAGGNRQRRRNRFVAMAGGLAVESSFAARKSNPA
jgi:hypothetical protein